MASAHRSSRLRGFRVRTFAVTAAPPKRPFWQLCRPPKAFSRGDRCFSPSWASKRHAEAQDWKSLGFGPLPWRLRLPNGHFGSFGGLQKHFPEEKRVSSCRELEKDTRAPGGKPKFSKIKLGILLIYSLCGTKANGPFSAKSWPGGFLEPRHLHLLLRCLQEAHRSSRLRGFRVRTFAVTAAPPKGPFWQLWRPPKAFSRGETCFPPSCSLQGAHKTSRLRGFRVRTCAVTAAPPKQPFWQLWRLPKPFSRGETWFPPRCSLQEAHRSSKLRGFRVRTSAVTAAPPKRPFWQLWRSPKAFSRGKTCFPPSCSLQGAHKSSRLRGFRVRTLAVTAAPPKRPFWQLWRPPKPFSRGETWFPPRCSLQEAHRSSKTKRV